MLSTSASICTFVNCIVYRSKVIITVLVYVPIWHIIVCFHGFWVSAKNKVVKTVEKPTNGFSFNLILFKWYLPC